MTDAGVLVMGLTVGLRHALEADHVAAVGTQLTRTPEAAHSQAAVSVSVSMPPRAAPECA